MSGNETFFECVTSCSLECEATHFSGSISFSHFSSQGTKFLMEAYGDLIENNYKVAVELTHRLNDDITLTYILNDFTNPTVYLMSEIITFAKTTQILGDGYSGFYNNTVTADFSMLRAEIDHFVTVYNSVYNSRQLVAQHFTLTISHVTDIDNLMKTAPVAFDNYLNSHVFYTTALSKLANLGTNAKLSIDYLARVIQDEKTEPKQRYSPNVFYSDNTAAQACNNLYEQTTEGLSKLLQAISYASQRISQWLVDNSANILNSTIDIAISEFELGINSSDVPGLWMLLECVDCNTTNYLAEYETWTQLFTTYLTTSIGDSLNNCLLQYEISLQSTKSATIPLQLAVPYWKLYDLLVTSLATLNTDLGQLKSIIHLYLTGSDSLQSTIANINTIFLSLTDAINKIEKVLMMSYNDWRNDVISWQADINVQYDQFVNSVVSLSQFLTNNTDLLDALLNMAIWRRPFAKLNAFGIGLFDEQVIMQIENDLRNYFQNYVTNVITAALTSATQFNLNYAQQRCNELQTMLTNWYSQVNNISDLFHQYGQQFLVADEVIK